MLARPDGGRHRRLTARAASRHTEGPAGSLRRAFGVRGAGRGGPAARVQRPSSTSRTALITLSWMSGARAGYMGSEKIWPASSSVTGSEPAP